MEYLISSLIIIFSLIISFLLGGLIYKYTKEDEALQDFYKKLEEDKEYAKSEKSSKDYIKEKNKIKVKLKPKFMIVISIITILAILFLYINPFGGYQKSFEASKYIEYILYSFLVCILIVSMFTDIKSCIIPDETNFVGFIVGIIVAFIVTWFDFKSGLNLVLGGLFGFISFYLVGQLGYLLYKKDGMGGGDIKLMGVIGLFLGFYNMIQVFVLSFFVAAIISIFLLITKIKKKDDYIPFGPFIVIAAYITMIYPMWNIMFPYIKII